MDQRSWACQWQKQSDVAKLPIPWKALGEVLLREHQAESNGAILTGPAFSHLIANLVLRELDQECSNQLSATYVRYVDDITLVGDRDAITKSVALIRSRLSEIGLELHDEGSLKTLRVPAHVWLQSRDDFHESQRPVSWIRLIGSLKKFLLWRPEQVNTLHDAMRESGYRIPIPHYRASTYDASYLEKVCRLAERAWYRRSTRDVSVASIVAQAKYLRKAYERDFIELIEEMQHASQFQRKRVVPKLRYRAARLVYLASDDALVRLARIADEVPELHFHAAVMVAVASGKIDQIVGLGTNAAQAAAQPLRAMGRTVSCSLDAVSSEAEEQALAVFWINGVMTRRPYDPLIKNSELIRIAADGASQTMMNSGTAFIREFSSLHGLADGPRHLRMMETPFDQDEDLTMDAIDQLQQYGSE